MLCVNYAVEPGVRDLNQYAEKLLFNYLLECENSGVHKAVYSSEDVKKLLGPSQARERNFSVYPGMVRTAFFRDGRAQLFPVQALARSGKGDFRTIGVTSENNKDFCRAAYECVRNTYPIDFNSVDISIFVPQQIPGGTQNMLGVAVYAAIISALRGICFPSEVAFIGGCDLFGNTFFDGNAIDYFLRAMSAGGVNKLYAPLGGSKLIFSNESCEHIDIIEAVDIRTLIRIAADNTSLRSDSNKLH